MPNHDDEVASTAAGTEWGCAVCVVGIAGRTASDIVRFMPWAESEDSVVSAEPLRNFAAGAVTDGMLSIRSTGGVALVAYMGASEGTNTGADTS